MERVPAVRRLRDGLHDIFATRRARRRLYVNMAAFSGAFVAVLQIILWITNTDRITGGTRALFVAALLVGLVVAVFSSIPKRALHLKAKAFTAELHLVPGDIFESPTAVRVVTANRHFDVEEPWVSRESLIGQLVAQLPGGKDALQQAIDDELAAGAGAGAGAVRQATEPGTTVFVPLAESVDVVLLAVTARNEVHRSAVLVDDISRALARLWDELRRRDVASASMPVIGSGLARAQVGLVPLLLMQVTSYVICSMETPICPLTIVMSPAELNHDIIRLVEDYCVELGLETV